MQNYIHSMHDRISNVELRALDNEARSRRNNLVFYNISEPDSETVAESRGGGGGGGGYSLCEGDG